MDEISVPAPNKPRKPILLRIVGVCVRLGYTAYFTFTAFVIFDALGGSSRLLATFLLLYVAFVVSVAVHEAGHALIAARVGWRVSMVAVGRVTLRFSPLRLTAGPRVSGLSGATFALPKETPDLRVKWFAVMAAGAAANVLFGLGLLLVAGLFKGDSALRSVIWSIAGLSMVTGLVNLLPYKARGALSDGAHIFDAVRGRDLGPFIRVATITDALIRSQRPRDWHPKLMAELEADAAKPDASGHESLCLYSYHLDKGDISKARIALTQAKEKMGARAELKIEEAFLAAHVDSDHIGARKFFNRVSSRFRWHPGYLRTEAAILLCEGKLDAAKDIVGQARKAFRKWPFTTDEDRELLDKLEQSVVERSLQGSAVAA